MFLKSAKGFLLTLAFALPAHGAVTWEYAGMPHQSGTSAPDGFDISSATFTSDTAIILDEPSSHLNWVGCEAWTSSGADQMDYEFLLSGDDAYFYPEVTQVAESGIAAMIRYYLWEPLPADIDPSSVHFFGPELQLGPVDVSDVPTSDDPLVVPETSTLGILMAIGAIFLFRRGPSRGGRLIRNAGQREHAFALPRAAWLVALRVELRAGVKCQKHGTP